ncbi:hypothetical protein DICA2_D04742 [Diutina catenulata]
MSFDAIPSLDLQDAFNPDTKPQFLATLQYALIEVGFFLLKNTAASGIGPSADDFAAIKEEAAKFFELPEKVKLDCEMIHSKHFLGYNKLSNEVTAKHADWREQIDLATELPPPKEGDPIYKNIEGPNLWPDASHAPQFRPVTERYIAKMSELSRVFTHLIAESIELPPDAFDKFFKENQQSKLKLIAYPDLAALAGKTAVAMEDSPGGQGCGPHRDSDFMTYIFQASPHSNSLEVQNYQGEWVSIPYVENALVCNTGQTIEAITKGVCKATIHRVITPKPGAGTRLSIPFFQTINLDSYKESVDNIPQRVIDKTAQRDARHAEWGYDTGFQFRPDVSKRPVGDAVFKNRIKSHQDVAARWYPQILKQVLSEY